MKRIVLLTALLLCVPALARAHEVPDVIHVGVFIKPEPGHALILVRMPANALIDFLLPTFADSNWLDLSIADADAAEGARVWIADMLSIYENGRLLPRPDLVTVRLSRLNDPSFRTFEDALARVNGPKLAADALVLQEQVTVDALLQAPIESPQSTFSFTPRFGRLGVLAYTTLTFLPPDGGQRQFLYEGDPETFVLNPDTGTAASRFLRRGAAHYFSDPLFLVFVLCVALLFQNFRSAWPFVVVLCAVEVLAVLVVLPWRMAPPWLPALSGVLTAAATVYLGVEAIVAGRGRRIGFAVLAGVVFGVTFWTTLQPLVQFGGAHPLAATLAFMAGIVGCELMAAVLAIAGTKLVARLSHVPRAIIVIAAAIAIHVSWQRMLDRAGALVLTPLPSSAVIAIAVVTVLLMGAAAAAALRRRQQRIHAVAGAA